MPPLLSGRDLSAGINNSGYFGSFVPPDIGGFVTTNPQANGSPVPPSNPFPPINYTQNYISTPDTSGAGMTGTDSNGGTGLSLYLIIGLLAVAAFAIFMVVR